jgi:hypothetical protein
MRASIVLSIIALLSCGGTSSSPAGDGAAGSGGSQTTAGPRQPDHGSPGTGKFVESGPAQRFGTSLALEPGAGFC